MRVFRYFDAKGGLATLTNRKMRLASPLTLNDPFELTPRVEEPSDELLEERLCSDYWVHEYFERCGRALGLTEDECRDKYFTTELPRRLDQARTSKSKNAQKLKWELVGKFAKVFRVLCCSYNYESILMWSHYADKHRGLVLEIETGELIPGVSLDPYTFDVQYRTSPPGMSALHSDLKSVGLDLNRVFRTKAIQWSYEEEVRLQFPVPDGVNNDAFVDQDFPPSCIKRVIVGCYVDRGSDFFHKIDMLADQAEYQHTKFQQAYIHQHDYRLCFAVRPR